MNGDVLDVYKRQVYTLYGEFSDNGFSVENGALKQSYGCLLYTSNTEKNILTA